MDFRSLFLSHLGVSRSLVVAIAAIACGLTGTAAAQQSPATGAMLLQLATPQATTLQSLPVGSLVTAANLPASGGATDASVRVTGGAGDGRERVIVQLREAALTRSVQGRGLRARRAAHQTLESEHQRVVDVIERLEAGSGRAVSSPPVRRQFFTVFNGLAATVGPDTLAALRAHPDVTAVHPDREVKAILDTSVSYVKAPAFWTSHGGFRGAGQVIAVVDTGIDYTHADLGACAWIGSGCKVAGGYDFHNDDADPVDDNGHGTHVAATAAGNGSLLGVAPDATLLAYKVLGADGSGYMSTVIAGIEAAVDPDGDLDTSDHADVINLSLGGPGDPDDPSSQAVDAATAAGVVVVAAAGNSGAYFTVGSPGTARTAITVASISEDGVPAWTNSAGPVAGTFDLKPEVAAPGVSICAARAQGTGLGPECIDTTHISISGTSMATPHVAGAAALLRGVLPSLSPQDIKSLIVQNGDPATFDPLQGGAGILDIVQAAAAHTIVSPQTLSFGRAVGSLPLWQQSRTLTVRNIGATTRSYTLTAAGQYWGLPAGATIVFSPQSFSLTAGASQSVEVSLSVDNVLVASATSAPWTYDAMITLKSPGETQLIPSIFLKTGLLRIHTDQQASLIYLHDRGNLYTAQVAAPTGLTTEVMIAPGTYDVITMFPGSLPGFVVHEGVVITDEKDETVNTTEALHTVELDGKNEVGAPLAHNIRLISLYHRASGLGLSVLSSYVAGAFSFPVSPISAAYDINVAALAQPLGKSYLISKALAGVSASVTLDNTPAELTRGTLRYFSDPGETPTGILEFLSVMIGSSIGVGFAGSEVSPVNRDLWFTPAPRDDSGVFVQSWVSLDATTPHMHNCPWYQGSTTPGVIEACNAMDRFNPAYETSTGELPLDLGPASFFLKMQNWGSGAMLRQVAAAWTWSFHSPGGDGPEAQTGTVGYRLLSGSTVAASGVLPQSGFGGPNPPYFNLASAGPYTLETDPLDYSVGGLRATSRVALSFDTTLPLGDVEPPWLERVEVRTADALAEVVATGASATLEIEAHDAADAGLTLSLARIDGIDEVAVALTDLGGGVFQAVMPDACDQAGPFNALLTATDAAGNQLREWLTPAFVCRPSTCGNGIVDAAEVCDDGNLLPSDGCNAVCSATETCGDGVLDSGEACDDGNNVAGDCCSTTCQAETAGTVCDNGAFCDGSDRCDAAGSCSRHSGSPCAAGAECNTGCDEVSDSCTVSPSASTCSSDSNTCTDDVCNGAGTCTHPLNVAPCNDGVFCNGADTCSGGVCALHAGDPCTTVGECVGACNEAAASCFSPWGTPCSDDGSPCSWDTCNGAGACAHVPAYEGVVCRDAAEPCDVPEVCNGANPACPADTGIVDTDGDTLCDGLDPCTNVAGTRNFLAPPLTRMALGRTFADTTPGNDTLALRGSFALPPAVAFWQLFPLGAEARVVMRDAFGSAAVDITLPNESYSSATGRGWMLSRNGRTWAWSDRSSAAPGGIQQMSLRLARGSISEAGATVRLAISAKAGDFPFTDGDVPVNVSITVGDAAAAAAGRCVESAFVTADCRLGPTATKLTCRR